MRPWKRRDQNMVRYLSMPWNALRGSLKTMSSLQFGAAGWEAERSGT